MLGMYFATEHGAFETEPVGIVELRQQKESGGEPTWLPGQVAWLKIDGTHIDYPVMQTNDNVWYLSHDYYGNSVASGWFPVASHQLNVTLLPGESKTFVGTAFIGSKPLISSV